eukprot:jgi/Picsp_1/5503/NSC_02862-R1_dof-like transcription factor
MSNSAKEVKDGVKQDGRVAEFVDAKPRSKLPALADNIPCPRCDSTKTKFCYYNNYNLKQPRYLCKSCQRYWTLGGLIRQVPPGAGRRKHKSSRRAGSSKHSGIALKKSELKTGNELASVNNCASALNFSMPMPNVSQDYFGVHSYLVPHSYSGDQDLPDPCE